MVDRPEARRVNTRIVARGGGVAIAIAFVVVSLLMLGINTIPSLRFADEPSVLPLQIVALLAGAVLAVCIGLIDDIWQIRARYQFLGQFALALFAVALGVTVKVVNVPVGDGTFHTGAIGAGVIAAVITVVWIVGMINSINFIDGLDGLSTGITFIAAMTLGVISLFVSTPREPLVALFCLILAGALLGFLKWNFNPASIFTGTSGIMFVGYVLSVLAVMGAGKVAVAALVLGVPIMDTFWIIVRRTAARRSPFSPDRNHIHHRLLDLGLSHRGTVMLIYCVCLLLAVLSLVLSNASQLYAFMGLILLFGLALYLIERLGGGATAIDESLDADTYDTDATSGNGAEAK
jgi:UDP-GlcNAc:undecaprenyl-phosphate GlcNAc-1-phosphate transferase